MSSAARVDAATTGLRRLYGQSMANLLLDLYEARRAWRDTVAAARRADREMYSDSIGRPILRESLVAYLDGLGTRAPRDGDDG